MVHIAQQIALIQGICSFLAADTLLHDRADADERVSPAALATWSAVLETLCWVQKRFPSWQSGAQQGCGMGLWTGEER